MPVVRRKRRNRKAKTTFLGIRIPINLDDRITVLAIKSLESKSSWVIRCLEQKAFRGLQEPASDALRAKS